MPEINSLVIPFIVLVAAYVVYKIMGSGQKRQQYESKKEFRRRMKEPNDAGYATQLFVLILIVILLILKFK